MSEPILDEIFQSDSKVNLVQADKGKRFLNYIIDAAAISAIQTVLVNTFDVLESISFGSFFQGYKVVFGFNLLFTPLYYFLTEYFLNGKTFGKFVTNTRVVTITGDKPTINQLIGRSFARIIPFEPFSYLGDSNIGWHDQMSETIVIDEQKSNTFSQNDELV